MHIFLFFKSKVYLVVDSAWATDGVHWRSWSGRRRKNVANV